MNDKKSSEKPLSGKRALFALAYVESLNASEAYRKAGYKSKNPDVDGHRLLVIPSIQAAIQKAMDERALLFKVSGDKVLKELAWVGFSDPRSLFNEDGSMKHPLEWSDACAHSVSSIEFVELFENRKEDGHKVRVKIGDLKKIKFWDKNNALSQIADHLGLKKKEPEDTGRATAQRLLMTELMRDLLPPIQ